MDVTELDPEQSGRFDLVLANDVVHDLPDPVLALKKIHGCLNEGGVLLVRDIESSSKLEDNIGGTYVFR